MATQQVMQRDPVNEHLKATSFVLGKTDRVISGQMAVKVTVDPNPDPQLQVFPGWSVGTDVVFNGLLLRKEMTSAIAARQLGNVEPWQRMLMSVMGLNYHELSHVLYTPPVTSDLRQRVTRNARLANAWNIMEDQRIELLFWSKYLPVDKFFSFMVMQWVVSNADPANPEYGGSYPWISQRKYLPLAFRSGMRKSYIANYDAAIAGGLDSTVLGIARKHGIGNGLHLAKKVESTLRAFIRADMEDDASVVKLIDTFADLIDLYAIATNGTPPPPMDSHNQHTNRNTGQAGASQKQQPELDDLLDEVDEEDADAELDDDTDSDDGDEDGDEDTDADGDDGDSDDNGDAGDGDSDTGDSDDDSDDEGGSDDPEESDSDTNSAGDQLVDSDKDAPDADMDLEAMMDELLQDDQVQQDLQQTTDTIADQIDNGAHHGGLPTARASAHPVAVPYSIAAKKMSDELRALRTGLEEHWVTEERQGRLNVRRAMRRQVIRGPFDMFDDWEPSTEAAGGVETVLLMDVSSSMSGMSAEAQHATWQVKSMFDSIRMPCTVYTYGERQRELYSAKEVAGSRIKAVSFSEGNTVPLPALYESARLFDKSELPNRVLVIVTDGQWAGEDECDAVINAMNKVGIVTVLVNLGYGRGTGLKSHSCQIVNQFDSPNAMVPMVRELVTKITKTAMSNR